MPLSHLLQALGPEVEDVQAIFRSVARKTPAMQTKLDKCLNKWNQLWSSSHVYIERLKCVEIVLTGLEEATTVVSEFELKLASYEELPSNVEALQVVSFMNTSWQAMDCLVINCLPFLYLAPMCAHIVSVLTLSVYVYLPPFNSNHALYLPNDHLFISVIFMLPKNSIAIHM